jgi:putative ABC transport system permease protein
MSYALLTLWRERQRYTAGVLAVAFSALLVALQCGLLLGMFSFVSRPVDHARADVWVTGRGVHSVDRGYPISDSYLTRLACQPEVERCEVYVQGFAYWLKRDGSAELAMVIGTRLDDDALGAVAELTPELRARLTEPGAVVVDESQVRQLGIRALEDNAEIAGRRVRVVGTVHGMGGMAGAYVFCSVRTARSLLRLSPEQTTFLIGRCRNPADAEGVVNQLRDHPSLSAYTSEELARRSWLNWLTRTRAGIGLGYAALLGLMVGAAVTSQTLYAATTASLREYTVLWALGIPRRRMAGLVLAQSLWIGVCGVLVALPVVFGLIRLADSVGLSILLPVWLLVLTVGLTLVTAMLSGLAALRTLWRMELTLLLRS